MTLNRWFLFLYTLLILLMLLMLRGFVQQQLTNLEAVPRNAGIVELLEKQVKDAPTPQSRKTALKALSQYRQVETINRITIKKNLVFYNALLVILFIGMILLFALGLYVITLPLKRLMQYSSLIAAGRIHTLPETPKLKRGLGGLSRAFEKLLRNVKESQKRLAAAEKEKTWREIARVMAHEIKNPLTPIRLSVDMVEEKTLDGSGLQKGFVEESMATIKEELGRLEALVNKFRDFSAIPELHRSPENLEAIIKEAARPFSTAMKIDITAKKMEDPCWVDSLKTHQMFLNLLKNSSEAGANEVTVYLERMDDEAKILFGDNGPGFSNDMLYQSFVPYATSKKDGTGLGLSVVKNIVEAHGGSIHAENHPKGGALMTIILDVSKGKEE